MNVNVFVELSYELPCSCVACFRANIFYFIFVPFGCGFDTVFVFHFIFLAWTNSELYLVDFRHILRIRTGMVGVEN